MYITFCFLQYVTPHRSSRLHTTTPAHMSQHVCHTLVKILVLRGISGLGGLCNVLFFANTKNRKPPREGHATRPPSLHTPRRPVARYSPYNTSQNSKQVVKKVQIQYLSSSTASSVPLTTPTGPMSSVPPLRHASCRYTKHSTLSRST